ncbi:MAG: hypothetical protein ACMG6E_04590 [Candidatus Roizmanbacteria bacterium]
MDPEALLCPLILIHNVRGAVSHSQGRLSEVLVRGILLDMIFFAPDDDLLGILEVSGGITSRGLTALLATLHHAVTLILVDVLLALVNYNVVLVFIIYLHAAPPDVLLNVIGSLFILESEYLLQKPFVLINQVHCLYIWEGGFCL